MIITGAVAAVLTILFMTMNNMRLRNRIDELQDLLDLQDEG